ncbi:Hypothetical protein PHPALM_13604 [Phytophthora palmivora]|uniref:Uncharacterized protein n=1 Tax=Phytophthora palmivora TaxID=4796 RepID=A0A2P4XWU2_9STRA|nr:Hypothetical protein PHPALM_13604 [Phytophthora palmivora]
MTACQAITKCDTPCSRKALKSGFCTQHDKDKRIEMYKKELSRMHKRVKRYLEISNDLHEKVTTIQHVDWLKYNLLMIGGAHCPYKCIIDNPGYKNQIEALFDLPANAALKEYDRPYDRLLKHMFPSFTSISQRERKRQDLLREAERDLQIDKHLTRK